MKKARPRVLVVDDEESLVETLSVLLKREGFGVISALSGSEAIEKLDEKPDVVLTDIRMPKVSGIDVLEEARSRESRTFRPCGDSLPKCWAISVQNGTSNLFFTGQRTWRALLRRR